MQKPSHTRSIFTAFCPAALSVFAALRSFLSLASCSLLAISHAQAGQIWDGGGGDNNWSTAANWDGGGGDNNWNTAANWDGDVFSTFTNGITFTGNDCTTVNN